MCPPHVCVHVCVCACRCLHTCVLFFTDCVNTERGPVEKSSSLGVASTGAASLATRDKDRARERNRDRTGTGTERGEGEEDNNTHKAHISNRHIHIHTACCPCELFRTPQLEHTHASPHACSTYAMFCSLLLVNVVRLTRCHCVERPVILSRIVMVLQWCDRIYMCCLWGEFQRMQQQTH